MVGRGSHKHHGCGCPSTGSGQRAISRPGSNSLHPTSTLAPTPASPQHPAPTSHSGPPAGISSPSCCQGRLVALSWATTAPTGTGTGVCRAAVARLAESGGWGWSAVAKSSAIRAAVLALARLTSRKRLSNGYES